MRTLFTVLIAGASVAGFATAASAEMGGCNWSKTQVTAEAPAPSTPATPVQTAQAPTTVQQ